MKHYRCRISVALATVLLVTILVAVLQTVAQQKPSVRYEASADQLLKGPQPWPYVPDPPAANAHLPDNGQLRYLPGSSAAFLQKVIDGETAVDWYPESHPKAPASVVLGIPGVYGPCGKCHLINGYGKSDIDSLNAKPVAYMRQQLEDMKNDLRHSAVLDTGMVHMIPIAKEIPERDATAALEYFHSIGPTKWIRVVETNTVPKTTSSPHQLLQIDPTGETEPIGNRIIEVPENYDRAQLRDPTLGYLAYVPVGSVAKGEVLVKTGGGRTLACSGCHGSDMHGGGTIPPIAGRSPSAFGRALYDFKVRARHGKNSPLMKPVVERLTSEDIVDLAAYLATLPQ